MEVIDYGTLAQLHDYVYSTPMNSPEREKRLAELTDSEQEQLYNYKVGLLSGRIKPEEYHEHQQQQQKGNGEMTYKEWKEANKKNTVEAMNKAVDFRVNHPDIDSRYRQKQEADERKRSEIMAIKDVAERTRMIALNLDLFD